MANIFGDAEIPDKEDVNPFGDSLEQEPQFSSTPQQPGILKQIAGGAQGLLEFGAAIPGAIGGTGLAAGHALMGEDPRIALEGLRGVMEETNLAKKVLPDDVLKELQSTYGYKIGSAPAEAIGKVFEGLGKLGGWGAALVGASKDTAEKTDAYTQLVAMALGLAAPGKGKFKGTQKEYFDLHDTILKGDPKWDAASKKAQETYPKEEVNPFGDKPVDPGMRAHAEDLGFMPEALPQSPYNIPEAVKRQIEEEHNPTNAPETRVEGQGELFTGRGALTPDELAARRFVTAEEGAGARDRAQPTETRFEIGREAEHPIASADLVETGAGRRPSEELPYTPEPRPEVPISRINPDIIATRADAYYKAAEDALNRGDKTKAEEYFKKGDDLYTQEQSLRRRISDFDIPRKKPKVKLSDIPKKEEPQFSSSDTAATRLRQQQEQQLAKQQAEAISRRDRQLSQDTVEPVRRAREPTRNWLERWQAWKQRNATGGRMSHRGQRGMAVIPFGKTAELIRDKLIPRIAEISKKLDNIGEAFKRGQITSGVYYKRREELLHERTTLNQRKQASEDVLYKEQNPGYKGIHDTLAEEALQKMRLPVNQGGQVLPFVPLKQRGAIGDWDRKIAKKGLTQTALDMKREISIEKRTLAEIVQEGKELDPKIIQDIAPESEGKIMSGFKRGMSHLLIDRTMARLSRERPGARTLIKWETDHRAAIDNRKDVSIRDALLEGLTPLKKANIPEVRGMLDVWQKAIGDAPLGREAFKTEKQWQQFQTIRRVYDRIHKDVTATRERFGRKALPWIDNYMAAIWEGDYRVNIFDQAGNKVGTFGMKTEIGGNRLAKAFRKEHPELKVDDATHIPEREQYHDLTAFEEAIRIHKGDYAATKALQQTYSRLLQTKGMGAHGLFRQGVFGYLGMEPGKLGVKNFQKAFEVYVKRAYNHIANLEKNDLAVQLDKLPPEIADKLPNTIDYLHQALNLAKGVDIAWTKQFPDKAFEELGYMTGIGRNFARNAISEVASVASIATLSTVRFLSVQPLQYLNAIPKLLQLKGRLPDARTMSVSMLKGLQGMLIPETRDAIQHELITWANKNEQLQAALVDMAGLRATDPTTSSTSRIGNAARVILGSVEKHTVRTPALLAFEYALRDITPNKIERFEQAAALMGYEMVTYDAASTPRIYGELGLTGEAAKPLKQYSHNTWGRFFEYMQGAKNHMEFAPLAGYMATQWGVGGIRGLIGIAEATFAITAVNALFSLDIPTPEQLWLKHGPANNKVANAVLFGIPSTLLGWDVSGTLTAPNLPQMFGVFPIEIASRAVYDSLKFAVKYLHGTNTDADLLQALQSSSPAAMREFWSEMFSEPGKPVPHAGAGMEGNYVRDPLEKGVAAIFNMKSIAEARADEVMRQFKQMFARDLDQKQTAIRAITDRVLKQEQITPELMNKFIAEGGNPKNLRQAIKQEMIRRSLPWMDRQLIGKEMTPQKAHKLQIMKEELDREFKRRQEEKSSGNVRQMAQGDDTASLTGPTKGITDYMSNWPKDGKTPFMGRGQGIVGNQGGIRPNLTNPAASEYQELRRRILARQRTM